MKLLKNPNRLWVAEQRNTAVFTLAGKAGAPGVPKAHEFKSVEQARAYLEAERDKRLADGYEVIDADAGLSAPFTIDGRRKEPRAIDAKFAHLEDAIRTHVRGGFTAPDEMEGVIDDLLENEPDAPHTLRARLEDLAREERRALRARTRPTPCVNDAIDAAFAELDSLGIVALQNAGYTQSDGWEDVNAEAARRVERGAPRPRGGCFYHFQDLERGVKGRGLMLGFAAFGDGPRRADYHDERTGASDEDTVAVGGVIVDVLEKHGISVKWDGTSKQRIEIAPFEWFRLQ